MSSSDLQNWYARRIRFWILLKTQNQGNLPRQHDGDPMPRFTLLALFFSPISCRLVPMG
jgi:hypothetical protein